MTDDYFWKTSVIRKRPFEWWDVDKTVCDIDRFPDLAEEDLKKSIEEIKKSMADKLTFKTRIVVTGKDPAIDIIPDAKGTELRLEQDELAALNKYVGEHIMSVDYSTAIYEAKTGLYYWPEDHEVLHEHQFTAEMNIAWIVLSTFNQKYPHLLIWVMQELIKDLNIGGNADWVLTQLFEKLTPEKLVRAVAITHGYKS